MRKTKNEYKPPSKLFVYGSALGGVAMAGGMLPTIFAVIPSETLPVTLGIAGAEAAIGGYLLHRHIEKDKKEDEELLKQNKRKKLKNVGL